MRKLQFGVAVILATAALAAGAQTRNEPSSSPFVYEAIGATPTLGGKSTTARAAAKPVVATKPAAASRSTNTPFTYDAVGATPQVDAKKAEAEMSARRLER